MQTERGETHQLGEGDVLALRGDQDGLDEELVAALGVRGRVLLHRLEQDCVQRKAESATAGRRGRVPVPARGNRERGRTLDLDRLARLDATRVGADAVLLGRGRLDLVGDGLRVVVRDGERALDELRERACGGGWRGVEGCGSVRGGGWAQGSGVGTRG